MLTFALLNALLTVAKLVSWLKTSPTRDEMIAQNERNFIVFCIER